MLTSLLFAAAFAQAPDGSALNTPDTSWDLSLHAELGALAVLSHRIQFGQSGSDFNYIDEGGQNNLFLFNRLSAELHINPRHTVVFLYQPLNLQTTSVIDRDVQVDDIVFPSGTPMALRYGFDFYRASWLYDFAESPDRELAVGASLQIRNASINFASLDGTMQRTNNDIGPVPVIKLRGRWNVGDSAWMGAEIDGFYAPIKYINGSNTDVVGAIVDGSYRVGLHAPGGIDPFLNLRVIAGGAEGTDDTPDEVFSDGYVVNWVSFAALSLGVSVR